MAGRCFNSVFPLKVSPNTANNQAEAIAGGRIQDTWSNGLISHGKAYVPLLGKGTGLEQQVVRIEAHWGNSLWGAQDW